ncbi:DUF3482 domain-containing protein, partial [Pseudomonas syringae]
EGWGRGRSARGRRGGGALLGLDALRKVDGARRDWAWMDGRGGDDRVHPETLKLMGVRVGGGGAAGAAAGAGVDLMVGGVTLGAAAVVGAIAGGALSTARSYGDRLLGKFKGRRALTVDDAVLRLPALPQRHALLALCVRGHASRHSTELTTPQDK